MTASDTLAQAHKLMSSSDIAQHALVLAAVVEGQKGLIDELVNYARTQRGTLEAAHTIGVKLVIAIRRVQSLAASGRTEQALALIASLAEVSSVAPLDPFPLDVGQVTEANREFPTLFNPVVTKGVS